MALPAERVSLPFNGDYLDKSGNGNIFTPNGVTFDTVNKHIGSASALGDGVNDSGEIADSPSLDASYIAVVNWVRYASPSLAVIAERSNGTFGVNDWTTFVNGGKLQVTMNLGAGNKAAISPLSYNDGNFHLMISMLDATGIRLFVDNIYVAENIVTGTLGVSSDPITLFARKGPVLPFSSNIDGFIMYGEGLTYGGVALGQAATGQIAEIWNGGVGIEPGAGPAFSPSWARNSNQIIGVSQ